MKKQYYQPLTELLTVCSESEMMVCSVRTSVSVYVEDYHDATFSNGESQWTIGFEEPGD